MKKIYIIPLFEIVPSEIDPSIICGSKEFVTKPNSVNGGDALGQESVDGSWDETGDGSDANNSKRGGFFFWE